MAALTPSQHRALLAAAPSLVYPTTDDERRKERYHLQDALGECLTGHRACSCLRTRIAPQVGVVRQGGKTDLKNLVVCGNAWVCPICGARTAAQDAEEIGRAIRAWARMGGRIMLVTRTNPHLAAGDAATVFKAHQAAEKLYKSGNPWRRLADRLGIEGSIRALETPYGRNGWHLHIHELMFLHGSSTATEASMQAALYSRWDSACIRAGIGAISAKHGVQVDEVKPADADKLASYLAKEVTGWALKRGTTGSLSPIDLLRTVDQAAPSPTAKSAARRLFADFAAAIKGRRRIHPAGVAKALIAAAQSEIEDERAAADPSTSELLAWIKKAGWSYLVKARFRGELARCSSALDVVHVVWCAQPAGCTLPISELVEVPGHIITRTGGVGTFAILPSAPFAAFAFAGLPGIPPPLCGVPPHAPPSPGGTGAGL